MTYRINKTDGNQLVDVPDGTFDTNTTSLTLIGKNVTAFGEALNENFVKLLENFSSSNAPEQALKGQLWYDTNSGRLNVYDGSNFRSAGGPVISPRTPSDLVAGDLWLNNSTNQLWFYDGVDLVLAGPIYSATQGTTGFIAETIIDNVNRSHSVAMLYAGATLLGIVSKDAFTPSQPIVGYAEGIKDIRVGFNVSSHPDTKFDVIATQAENIITDTGDLKSASQIVYNDEDQVIVGGLTLQSAAGLVIGAAEDVDLKIDNNKFVIEQKITGQDFGIKTKTPTGTVEVMTVDAANTRVGFFTDSPSEAVDINGNLRVAGDLLVDGTSTQINVVELEIEDKNIVLAANSTDDVAANGGGITLKGTTDKTFNWVNSTNSWTSSEHIDLAAAKYFAIESNMVLNATSLGAGVLRSSLIELGNLEYMQMDNNGIRIEDNQMSLSSGDIVINPQLGNVQLSSKKITNMADPSSDQDAATKSYVDEAVFLRGLAMSMDVTDLMDDPDPNDSIATILNDIAPFYDSVSAPNGIAVNGTRLRLHCTISNITIDDISYQPQEDTGSGGDFSRESADKNGIPNAQPVISDISTTQTITAPNASVSITRINKDFIMTAGVWVYDAVTGDY